MQFVLDCSVAISWCLVDENNNYANAILAMMVDSEAFVPGIWSLEIANTLVVAERRNRITQDQSEQAITLLQSLLIQVDLATDKNALDSTLKLARREGLAAYDAAYLELALRLKLPLATLDNRLAEAATRCGVSLIVVDEQSSI
ncbi:type II toxin-antitoxin system VapC family toxin [Dolichospermum sp. ST_con]|nr:type II toxin-antitoxin system VapC family toxin [Dolichospermum sp. ST_con]MDD1421548.1 type II toxin-antitoxin system VapC family toxin [Dolichospermum sp. ST_sed1]MDD1426500.1 type II toxin-antitoxin system VapC family toxin [Dolichospermum sp. ST_sed9]MDD1430914.1 type II toxin-antitoxin system VapC family toxin [Dolichospermum sp. ST_sed6]MDD1438207.1 type II toxin-antitoxin system VapC family toxin [Dolichospermum sp. ST_sed10]MDD1443994.1 type II toxin-antitoxin system VapC family to